MDAKGFPLNYVGSLTAVKQMIASEHERLTN